MPILPPATKPCAHFLWQSLSVLESHIDTPTERLEGAKLLRWIPEEDDPSKSALDILEYPHVNFSRTEKAEARIMLCVGEFTFGLGFSLTLLAEGLHLLCAWHLWFLSPLLGRTGSGKTTLLNALCNYLAGVKLHDKFRYVLKGTGEHDSRKYSTCFFVTCLFLSSESCVCLNRRPSHS